MHHLILLELKPDTGEGNAGSLMLPCFRAATASDDLLSLIKNSGAL